MRYIGQNSKKQVIFYEKKNNFFNNAIKVYTNGPNELKIGTEVVFKVFKKIVEPFLKICIFKNVMAAQYFPVVIAYFRFVGRLYISHNFSDIKYVAKYL